MRPDPRLAVAIFFAHAAMASSTDGVPEGRDALRAYAQFAYHAYETAAADARQLRTATHALATDPTERRLREARRAWLMARDSYGRTEVLRFYDGPIDFTNPGTGESGPELRINAWPVDESYIEAIIADDALPITVETLTERNGVEDETQVMLGYHAVEFLLWGPDTRQGKPGRRRASAFSADDPSGERRCRYLEVATQALLEELEGLIAAWAPESGDNFRAELMASDPDEAIGRVLTGFSRLSGFELAMERLAVPLDSGDQEDEHSCFSDNTHNDFVANARGLIAVHRALGPYLVTVDPELAGLITIQLDRVEQGVRRLHRPFDRLLTRPADSRARRQAESLVVSLQLLADLAKAMRSRVTDATR